MFQMKKPFSADRFQSLSTTCFFFDISTEKRMEMMYRLIAHFRQTLRRPIMNARCIHSRVERTWAREIHKHRARQKVGEFTVPRRGGEMNGAWRYTRSVLCYCQSWLSPAQFMCVRCTYSLSSALKHFAAYIVQFTDTMKTKWAAFIHVHRSNSRMRCAFCLAPLLYLSEPRACAPSLPPPHSLSTSAIQRCISNTLFLPLYGFVCCVGKCLCVWLRVNDNYSIV